MTIKITYLSHDGFLIQWGKLTIAIDPYGIKDKFPMANYVLITHAHYDHLSPEDVKKITNEESVIVIPATCAAEASAIPAVIKPIHTQEELEFPQFRVKALPAYNLNKRFHPKHAGGAGYLLTIEGKRIYHAGDTDHIPEMKTFGPMDLALLPVSGTYVMTAQEAVEAAKDLQCKHAIPMHFGIIVGSLEDAQYFVQNAPCPTTLLKPGESWTLA